MSITSVVTRPADRIQAIYNAYYGRPADPDGLVFWTQQLAAANGNLRAILPAFGNSAESNALFGLNASSTSAVRQIYNIILGRDPDAAGLEFYRSRLDSGQLTKAEVAFAVFDGINPNDPVDGALTLNKLRVANAFTDALNTNTQAENNYTGTPAAVVGRDWLQFVSRSASDTTNLVDSANGFVQARLVDAPRGVVADPFDFDVVLSGTAANNAGAQFRAAFDKLEQFLFNGLPSFFDPNLRQTIDDVRVTVTVGFIDGPSGVVAVAGPDMLRPTGSQLPYLGSMRVDSADLDTMLRDGTFESVIIHEAMHVLGFGTLWDNKGFNSTFGQYSGLQGVLEYRALTGNESVAFVPLESSTGQGSDNGHWSERIFGDEIMTPIVGNQIVFSRLSLAGLADLGYEVSYAGAQFYAL